MSLLRQLFGAIAPRSSGSYHPGNSALAALFGLGEESAGIAVDEYKALSYSAFWYGVRLLSESVASVPLYVYRRRADGGKEKATDHEAYQVLHDSFNPELTSFQAREAGQAHLLTWGNTFAEIEPLGNGRVSALWPLTPDCVHPDRDKQDRLIYRVDGLGSSVPIPAERMLHVPGLGFDGIVGYSVVALARQAISLGLATERHGATLFGNGARPGGLLTHDGTPTPQARGEMREGWTREHGGARANRVGVLWGGWKWQPMSLPPEDAQFLETRAFQREEVGLWLNIPPFKLGVSKAATYASVEQFAIDFVVYTLRPWWVRWEAEYNRKLLRADERDRYFTRHLGDALMRGDTAARTSALLSQFMHGNLTLDEWRDIEDRNPLPDGLGQTHFVPANLMPIERVLEEPAVPAPAPAVEEPIAEETEEDAGEEEQAADGDASAAGQDALSGEVEAAHRLLLVETIARLLRKEAQALRRAAGDPGRFLGAVEDFYAQHEELCRMSLLPAIRAWLSVRGQSRRADAVARWAAECYCTSARQALVELAGTCTAAALAPQVDRLLRQWDVTVPTRGADWILLEQAYSDEQPRDELGRFGSGGGSGDGSGDGSGEDAAGDAGGDAGGGSDRTDSSAGADDRAAARDKEDEQRAQAREKEDEQIAREREAQDERREEVNRRLEEERAERRSREDDERAARREAEDRDREDLRDAEDALTTRLRREDDGELDRQRASEDEALESARDQEDRRIDDPDEQERLAGERDREDEARNAARTQADAERERGREEEDAERERGREEEDAERERVRAQEDDATTAQRDAEDAWSEDIRTRVEGIIEERRAQEDAERQKARDEEDAEVERRRDQEDGV